MTESRRTWYKTDTLWSRYCLCTTDLCNSAEYVEGPVTRYCTNSSLTDLVSGSRRILCSRSRGVLGARRGGGGGRAASSASPAAACSTGRPPPVTSLSEWMHGTDLAKVACFLGISACFYLQCNWFHPSRSSSSCALKKRSRMTVQNGPERSQMTVPNDGTE